jgi:hypothetical protein
MRLNKRARFNYWSCSKLADFIRGSEKPYALPWDEWEVWRKKSAKKHPYRYWIAEEVLDFLQDVVNFPMDFYHTIEIYVRNRYIDKIHYLHTGLKPGTYYDLDWRILNGLFNELVIYVENELAHTMKSYKNRNYKFVKSRCRIAGLDHLNWASQLNMNEDNGINPEHEDYGKPTHQAIVAKKVYELYNWWLNRVNRIDPHVLYTKEKYGKYYYRKIAEMEDAYNKEDTDMLVELVKIRGSLWT